MDRIIIIDKEAYEIVGRSEDMISLQLITDERILDKL